MSQKPQNEYFDGLEDKHIEARLYWVNGVSVHDGYCWATELVGVKPRGDEMA